MIDNISQIRSFNRVVTQRIGALNNCYMGRDRPLAESRLLFEIGVDGITVRDLRARLGLDSGFVSRMLRSLEEKDLVTTTRAKDDARVRFARLTRSGKTELRQLNKLSDQLAASILEPLNARQRDKLLAAMAEVERLLLASAVSFQIEKPSSRDAQWCLNEYFEEINDRFDEGFDPDLSIVASKEFTPPGGYLLIARLFGELIGCGGLLVQDESVGLIKRMWIDRHARGLGLGRKMLDELERQARECNLKIIQLETNRTLKEAQGLYRSSGYTEVDSFNDEIYADHWFQKRLD